jgi:hypothetical protein
MTAPVPLPLVPDPAGQALRISPTDVSQFVRLEQCERYLRFRLAERSGRTFLREYDVTPQRITPLLSLSGREFEGSVEQEIARRHRTVQYADRATGEVDRPANNDAVIEEARKLPPGELVILLQPRLQAEIDGWLIRGDLDVLRLERRGDGHLHALITDLKSTTEAKVEHRLQLAFYHLMLARLFEQHGAPGPQIQTGVLFRGPAEPTPTQAEQLKPLRDAARTWLGLEDGLLEVVADPDAYLQAARDLVTGPGSTARRVALAPFEAIPYSLSYKCDGCLYNEYCLKWSAEREDLSLLPYMSGVEKEALRRHGVGTIEALARLKGLRPDGELDTAAGQEAVVRRLAATWPVGPRLDELVHRARGFRRHAKKDGTAALSYVPGKGTSTLPVSTPERNPNLVRVYVEAQHDYLHDRIYLLGALVVACNDEAYKGINVLIQRNGAQDFFWKATIRDLDETDWEECKLDIHHIFPRAWCDKQVPPIPPRRYNSILNKTPISYKANRMIGGRSPSDYLKQLQSHKNVQLDDPGMDRILASHYNDPARLRANDFEGFIEQRRKSLINLISQVMGKPVVATGEAVADDDVDEEEDAAATVSPASSLDLATSDGAASTETNSAGGRQKGKWPNWDAALAAVTNPAIVTLFREELGASRENYLPRRSLRYRVNDKRRWNVRARSRYAYVSQEGRFDGDDAYWRSGLSQPDQVKAVVGDKVLRFRLSTEGDVKFFRQAVKDKSEVQWSDGQTDEGPEEDGLNAIFSDTILSLLTQYGPMTTLEMYPYIKQRHPDLCDDNIPYTWRGRDMGPLWQHRVRTAQQHMLRRPKPPLRYDKASGRWTKL